MDGAVLASGLVDTKVAGTLDGTTPARVTLTGSLDGAGLVSILAPGSFVLVGPLEGTVLTGAGLAGTLEVTVLSGFRIGGEGTELVVTELAGTSEGTLLGQMEAMAWLPAPPAEGKLVEEGEEEKVGPTEVAETAGPGKRLALGVERARGWKETVGDTGPRGDVELESGPAGVKDKNTAPKDYCSQSQRRVPLPQVTPPLL